MTLLDSTIRGLQHELPDHLKHRLQVVQDGAVPPQAKFVLYWMVMAVRDHENAALDTAVFCANALGLPVLVYHGLSERYEYANDRHHTFILQGAIDVAAALGRRGIAYALHVERPGHRGAVLGELLREAALVVHETLPVPPLNAWAARLAERAKALGTGVWSVDASCVVPMPLVDRLFERAYDFRTAAKRLVALAMKTAWVDVRPKQPPPQDLGLPFAPVQADTLGPRELAALVLSCDIDHTVGPIPDRPGGMQAGYARWRAFATAGLSGYAKRRNDPLIDGTSRLSPYLHYGHVSALRLAKETALVSGDGPDKFLDELLVWREVAWHWANKIGSKRLETLAALPEWAQQTLEQHRGDPRESLTEGELENAHSGHPLWDAMERGLLAHGELHNNLRMTWGKALAEWAQSPEEAQRLLIAFNHRYALDGRDPASYGGLYWCLGLFDRPFSPERAVLGRVRPRPLSLHANRFALSDYVAVTHRCLRPRLRRVAIVGAGLSGLVCARALTNHNHSVTVFEKFVAPGGRLGAFSVPLGDAPPRPPATATVDMGAQYFTVRDHRFAREIERLQRQGGAALWPAHIFPSRSEHQKRWVGLPTMASLANDFARGLPIRFGHKVIAIERAPNDTYGLAIESPTAGRVTEGPFDVVLVCAPSPEAATLLHAVSPSLSDKARAVQMSPTLALGIVLPTGNGSLDLQFDAAFVRNESANPTSGPALLSWVARDSSKPGRFSGNERWVLHAGPEWSTAHFTDSTAAITQALLESFAQEFKIELPRLEGSALIRWSAALAPTPLAAGAFYDHDLRLGMAGDWCMGGRVEGAYLSGAALAGHVLSLASISPVVAS